SKLKEIQVIKFISILFVYSPSKTKFVLMMQTSVVQGKAELSQSNQEDLQSSNRDIENSDKNIKQLMDMVASMETELSNLKSSLDSAQSELDNERNILSAFDEEIKELQTAIKTKTAQTTEVQLEISRINHELERFLKEKQTAQQAILQMEQNYDWIIQQKQLTYDFVNNNPSECKKMLRQLEEKHNNMRKKINAKASLNQMLATVLKDKKKIEDTIVSLDDYKKDALQRTWEKVNGDFGAIFADLLPNSFAKLEPLEGQDLTHGLEVKVQLGGVWKQSLSELSGGQRSLIALSLILSLLQFKPAPMYILDEVDAALDLSHTQNIGQLLRTRFKGSQFIVVSLKDGMFNNANVLFRTRFHDGTSVVE
ncbi:2219_t:CDS:2, partial [Racocetra fulgida]